MTSSLTGKVAWVTGASGGLGTGIVASLQEAGCTVVSTDLSTTPPMTAERVIHRHCDVTRQEDIDETVGFCQNELGRLDILVNNAGISEHIGIFDITRTFWDRMMGINCGAYFFCAQAAAKVMRDRGQGGAIVNTVSIGSERPSSSAAYASSKGGVRTLTFALAVELARYGIRVNGISPGSVASPMSRHNFANPQVRDALVSRIPLGRIGEPKNIGSAVVFLASDDAAYITGTILPVDGGMLIQPWRPAAPPETDRV